MARTTVVLLPLLLAPLFLPGPLWIRLVMIVAAVAVGQLYSISYMEESCEHRLVKHGYSHGTARATREAANAQQDAAQRARYVARYRPAEAVADRTQGPQPGSGGGSQRPENSA